MAETYYIVTQDDCTYPFDGTFHTETDAIALAKKLSNGYHDRFNIFKLIQTHTYAPSVCTSCDGFVVKGGALHDGQVAL